MRAYLCLPQCAIIDCNISDLPIKIMRGRIVPTNIPAVLREQIPFVVSSHDGRESSSLQARVNFKMGSASRIPAALDDYRIDGLIEMHIPQID